jgi:hypothetical protein
MKARKQPRRLTEIGIKEFESSKEVARIQKDMLDRFARSSIDPGRYWALRDRRSNYCAYKTCQEACWFGTRLRHKWNISEEKVPVIEWDTLTRPNFQDMWRRREEHKKKLK